MGKNIIGNNIIKHRKKLGYSQSDLAEKTNLSRRAIAYYEREANNEIFDKLEMIANALYVSVSDLLMDENNSISETEKGIIELDTRIIKRIMQIKKLSIRDQNSIWKYIDFIIENSNSRKHTQEIK